MAQDVKTTRASWQLEVDQFAANDELEEGHGGVCTADATRWHTRQERDLLHAISDLSTNEDSSRITLGQ